jgi:hypothetical protein
VNLWINQSIHQPIARGDEYSSSTNFELLQPESQYQFSEFYSIQRSHFFNQFDFFIMPQIISDTFQELFTTLFQSIGLGGEYRSRWEMAWNSTRIPQ